MTIGKIDMDQHYKRVVDNKPDSDFFLHPTEANVQHRIARAEQAPRVIPVVAFDTPAFQTVVHTEITPQPVASEVGAKHRLGEKPKMIKSLVSAAQRGLRGF